MSSAWTRLFMASIWDQSFFLHLSCINRGKKEAGEDNTHLKMKRGHFHGNSFSSSPVHIEREDERGLHGGMMLTVPWSWKMIDSFLMEMICLCWSSHQDLPNEEFILITG